MPGHNFHRDVWERFRSDNESWLAGPSIKFCLWAPPLMSYGHPGSYSKTRQPSVTSVGKCTLQICRWIQNKWAFDVCSSYSIYNMSAFLRRSWNAFQVCLIRVTTVVWNYNPDNGPAVQPGALLSGREAAFVRRIKGKLSATRGFHLRPLRCRGDGNERSHDGTSLSVPHLSCDQRRQSTVPVALKTVKQRLP